MDRSMKKILAFILLAFGLNAFAIYGEDNRAEFSQIKDSKIKKTAQAVAYQLYKDELRGWTFQRYWRIVTRQFKEYGVCPNEKFADQPTMRKGCTGVLVGKKHLLTAGNCTTEHYCWNGLFYWMFNYHLNGDASEFNVKRHKKNFYQCEKIISRVFDPSAGVSYTLMELDDEVEGIEPVKVSFKDSIDEDQELISMGHVDGLTLKIADQVYVSEQDQNFFLSNSDIMGSSKGSALFNIKTMELEGIQIYGNPNYVDNGNCKESYKIDSDKGEELSIKPNYIRNLLEEINR